MADDTIQVTFGADASALVSAIQLAEAQLRGLQTQMRALAADMITTGRAADAGLKTQLGGLAGTSLAVGEHLSELRAEFAALTTGARAAGEGVAAADAVIGHGAGAGFYVREVRALWDELTSGRDRQAMGTFSNLAISFAQSHTALIPLIAGAISAAAALGYLVYQAIEYKNAVQGIQATGVIDQFQMTATAAGQLASAVAEAGNVSYTNAEKFAAPFLAIGPGGDKVAQIAASFLPEYTKANIDAAKAGEELSATFTKYNTAGLEYIAATKGMSTEQRAHAAALAASGDRAGVYSIILDAMEIRLGKNASDTLAAAAANETLSESIGNAAAAEAGLDTTLDQAAAGATRAQAAIEAHARALTGLRSEAEKQFGQSKLIDQQQQAASDKITDKTDTEGAKIRTLTGELAQQEAQLAKLNSTAAAPAPSGGGGGSSDQIKKAEADLYSLQAQLALVKNAYNQIDLSQAGAFRDPNTQALIAKEQQLTLAVNDAKAALDKMMGAPPSVASQDAAARLSLSIARIKDELRQAQERAAGGLIPTTAFDRAQEDIKRFEDSEKAKGPVSKKLTYEIEILRKEGANVPGDTKEGQQFADEIAAKTKAAQAAQVSEANKSDDVEAARTRQTADQEVATEAAKYSRIAQLAGVGSTEELAARQVYNGKLKGLDEQHVADAADEINREVAQVRDATEQKVKGYQDDVKNHRLTAQQAATDTAAELQQEKALVDVLYAQKAGLYANDAAEQRKVGDQKLAAERQTDDQIAASNRQAADSYQKTWTSAADEVESAFNSQIRGLLEGTETWGTAAKKVLEDFVVKAIESFEKFAVNAILQYAVVNQAAGASGAIQSATNTTASSGGLAGLFASFFGGGGAARGVGGAAGAAGAAGGAGAAAQAANTAATTANTAATTAQGGAQAAGTAATTGQTVATTGNTVSTTGNTVTTGATTVATGANTVSTSVNTATQTTGIGTWVANTASTIANTIATDAAAIGKLFGFATGTPMVQQTGLAMIHKGEAIVPAEVNPFKRLASFDIGAYDIPQDQLAMVHRNELVMPAAEAGAFRSMLAGGQGQGNGSGAEGGSLREGGGGGQSFSINPTVHHHVTAMDSQDVQRTLRANARPMMKEINDGIRRGAHLGLRRLGGAF